MTGHGSDHFVEEHSALPSETGQFSIQVGNYHHHHALQRSYSTSEMYELRFRNDAVFRQETTRFQEQKRRTVLQSASADEDEWRTAIKRQLEEELDRQVREALETPPLTGRDNDSDDNKDYIDHKQQKLQNAEQLSSNINLAEMTAKERAYANSKQWKIMEAERKLRRFMHNQQQATQPGAASDYVLNTDLFTYGSSVVSKEVTAFPDLPGNIKCHKHYSQVVRKGEKNLGSLTTVERFEFYYAFTQSGFREAMRFGRLPDGSNLKEIGSGKYKDKYGIVRDEHGPFWPPDTGPLFATPTLIRSVPSKAEPVLEHICENFRQTVDTQHHRYNQKWRGVQIVYDSEKSGRLYEPPPVSEDNAPSLLFESRFESANLRQARRIGQFEYELVLKTDLYTQRHTQWYYFQVKRPLPGVTYKFKIVNLLKRTSLYSHGMRPLLYSERDARVKRVGWTRTGHHISYYKNEHNLQCPLLLRDRTHYVLEWQMEFANDEDTYYLAHCYPYTYTDLKDDLDHLLSQEQRAKVMKREVMCETRAGNSCFLITVTNFESEKSNKEGVEGKKSIVVTARVHPGETNSSWMMKGLLDFITSSSQVAKILRENFIFKIVPMLNPDGVIVGNYRCSLAARDLNRNYRHPRKESFPTIWHTKNVLEDLLRFSKVMIYCDMHGHSRKQNVFMYGCNTGEKKNGPLGFSLPEQLLKERLFPWLMAMKAPDKFSFRGCKFAVRKCKEATGRVVMFKQMKISNSFTMEATFCGTNICRGDRRHFSSSDFEQMGKIFCEVALEYHQMQLNKRRQSEIAMSITRAVAQQVLEARGLLPDELPDFTTEKGRDQLKGLGLEKSLDPSEEYARALSQLLRQEYENLPKPSATKQEKTAGKALDLDSMTMEELVELLSARSVEGCVHVLQQLSADVTEMQSDSSSDSDSESEPEMPYQEPKPRKKKKKHKKKSQSEHGSAAYERKKRNKQREQEENRPKSISTSTVATRMTSKNFAKTYPGFVNKYVGRTNGGIPCFAEERLMERTAKRMEEMKRRLEEDQYQRDALLFASELGQTGQPRDYLPGSYIVSQGRGTTFDIQAQFGQTHGMHVRTGYIHAESPTSPLRRSDASSDDDSDDDIPQHHHPVPAIHSPYQHYPISQHPITILPTKIQKLPPLANSMKRTYTMGTLGKHRVSEPDSCSIPLRHTTQGMMVTSLTPRDENTNTKVKPSGQNTATSVVNQVFTKPAHRQKTVITFPKIPSTHALPVARYARKHGERHATCE